MPPIPQKKDAPLPTARGIRRACSKELYRTVKRLKVYVPDDAVEEGEKLYYRKVIANLIWIHENRSNRKLLCDWWDESVRPELAELWKVDEAHLGKAFREAFGG
ncbi:dehydrogenase [Paenibacillus chibensis]|uniref:Dehydrogenase n=1 Tax=Paenibacillus chibensis TaxID=59846 RepID=A0ABU6PQS4_9BACL|nr:dehydrogenase [Paenibacillus chibensis]MEC0370816.1 dehydrogenase [Paenibacillus chibensis]MED5017229.1 dehydrogenase [Paenibacillus chibensis]